MSNYLDNQIMDAPKLVVVRVVDIHEIVQSDEVGSVVDIQHAGLDVVDVAAVVVDVLGGSLAVSEDVVVVAMINHKETAGLDELVEVLKTFFVVSHVSVKVGKMSK